MIEKALFKVLSTPSGNQYQSALEYEDFVDSRENLVAYTEEMLPNHEIIRVAGDCFCILHAFKECIIKARAYEISLPDIKQELKRELSDACYLTLFPEIRVKEQVEQFLLNPLVSYNNDVCDIFLATLGNAYKVNIKIYQSSLGECWVTDLSNVQKGFDTTLHFARSLSVHIDAIVPKNNSESSKNENQVMHLSDIFLG